MPSLGFSIGSVRVRERALLTQEQLERLLAASTARDALKVLQEFGYGAGEDASSDHAYEAWIEKALAQSVDFLRNACPDIRVANAFLLDVDFHNLKVFLKARQLGSDPERLLLAGGQVPIPLMKEAVATAEYRRLPQGFQEPLQKLEKELALGFDPQTVNIRLDSEMVRLAVADLRAARFELGVAYFRAWADRANILTLLRLKAMKRDPAQLRSAFLPEGRYALKELMSAWDNPAALRVQAEYGAFLRQGLLAWEAGEGLTALERAFDDTLLDLFTQKRYHNAGYEPLIGYYLARVRECANIRLIMVSKINGLPTAVVTERLRELYG